MLLRYLAFGLGAAVTQPQRGPVRFVQDSLEDGERIEHLPVKTSPQVVLDVVVATDVGKH